MFVDQKISQGLEMGSQGLGMEELLGSQGGCYLVEGTSNLPKGKSSERHIIKEPEGPNAALQPT